MPSSARPWPRVPKILTKSNMVQPPRVRVQRRPVHGVLLLDKPLGLSSNDALQKAKWLLRAEKAGHTGTLDPLATGVLPLCFGAATKFSQLQLEAAKTYEAIALLGTTTTTGDAEGDAIDEERAEDAVDAPRDRLGLERRDRAESPELQPRLLRERADLEALLVVLPAAVGVPRDRRLVRRVQEAVEERLVLPGLERGDRRDPLLVGLLTPVPVERRRVAGRRARERGHAVLRVDLRYARLERGGLERFASVDALFADLHADD